MAPAPGNVTARWIGPYVAECGGQILVPFQSTFELPLEEAENSDNWQIGEAPKVLKKDLLARAAELGIPISGTPTNAQLIELIAAAEAAAEAAAAGETPPEDPPAEPIEGADA